MHGTFSLADGPQKIKKETAFPEYICFVNDGSFFFHRKFVCPGTLGLGNLFSIFWIEAMVLVYTAQ